jgi:rhamnose transport system ATP-binding protein
VTPDDIVQAMVGRVLAARAPVDGRARASASPAEAPLLRVQGLTRVPCFEDISLSIAGGEIVALFGLVGSGRTELLETLVGLARPDRGAIAVEGRPCAFGSPRDAARAGVALVPEDRQREGLFFNLNLRHNLVLPLAEMRGDTLVRRAERETSAALLRDWRIKARSVDDTPDCLSGGNQQKVVLAKWLALRPRVLLLDEPTKGVDVGAKYEIHGIVRGMAANGAACLVVSSDLPEVLALADRILVMREGRLRGEIAAAGAPGVNEEQVMRMAATTAGEAA